MHARESADAVRPGEGVVLGCRLSSPRVRQYDKQERKNTYVVSLIFGMVAP